MGYKKKAIKGLSWMSILHILVRGIALVKIVVLARLLSPLDLGIFGMTVIVVGLLETVSEFGISTFLIQQKNNAFKFIDTGWVMQIVRGFILTAILVSFAFPVSLFFHEPKLTLMILIAGFNPFIKGFENPYVVFFQKELQFHMEFFYRALIILSDFFISIVLVFVTRSIFGLAASMVLSSLIGVLFTWLFFYQRPSFRLSFLHVREIFHFWKTQSLISVFSYLTNQIDSIIIGRFFGASSLGIYQVAQRFSSTLMIEISDIFGKVTLPVYAKISYDKERLLNAYKKIVGLLFLVELFLFVFLLFLSNDLVLLLGKSKWIGVEEFLPLLALYGFIASVTGSVGSLLFSLKKQEMLSKLGFFRFIIVFPLMVIFTSQFGVIGAVYALIASLLLIQPLSLYWIFSVFKKNG